MLQFGLVKFIFVFEDILNFKWRLWTTISNIKLDKNKTIRI